MKKPEKKDCSCPTNDNVICCCGYGEHNQAIDDYEAFLPNQIDIENALLNMAEDAGVRDKYLDLFGALGVRLQAQAIAKRIGKL